MALRFRVKLSDIIRSHMSSIYSQDYCSMKVMERKNMKICNVIKMETREKLNHETLCINRFVIYRHMMYVVILYDIFRNDIIIQID